MLRLRWQRPMQWEGDVHSSQSLNAQFTGTHSSHKGQPDSSLQDTKSSCVPEHRLPSPITKPAICALGGFSSTSIRPRDRLRDADPQLAEQDPIVCQSSQTHQTLLGHFSGQAPTCRESLASHRRPCTGNVLIFLLRVLSPSHLVQELQSSQSPQAQSCFAEHGLFPQPPISWRLLRQGDPPFAAGTATFRRRSRWPPPQVAEHSPHSAQELISQSRGLPKPQASARPAALSSARSSIWVLHERTSARASPLQKEPVPEPLMAIVLFRLWMPLQLLEHSLQGP
mmetsp:Transcript_69176/g.150521  ORF Transcript_69176/g.150521 Transcript_69176/m.150521 type:complete len:283 (-) Transcript_69176:2-850(-)